MRVTVCQLSDNRASFEREWAALTQHVQEENSSLVLLPELVFSEWFPERDTFDESVWKAALAQNEAWLPRLSELAPATVLATRPIEKDGKRYNQAFIWTPDGTLTSAHHKSYLPQENGFWEASWFDRAPGDFQTTQLGFVSVGFSICTELCFMEHARDYGKQGASLIATPRCTATRDKWLAGGQSAAVISGAFHLSSNRTGTGVTAGVPFSGTGWMIDPDGTILATTSNEQPFITMAIDLQHANEAKSTYPRYVNTL